MSAGDLWADQELFQQFVNALRECLGLEPLYMAGNIFRERSKRAYATRERRGKPLRRYAGRAA